MCYKSIFEPFFKQDIKERNGRGQSEAEQVVTEIGVILALCLGVALLVQLALVESGYG